jgi:probable HAF family extracellular repeat protein
MAAALVAAAAMASAAEAAPVYRVTNLAAIDARFQVGWSINEAGQVAGFSASGRALIYTPGSGVLDLGTLGGGGALAYGINDAGQVAGYSMTADGIERPFIYTPGLGMLDIGPSSGANARAFSINALGQVPIQAWGYRCSIFTPGPGLADSPCAIAVNSAGVLSNVPGTGLGWGIDGWAVNEHGQIAGYTYPAGGPEHAFLYTPDTGLMDLGTLPGGAWSQAYGLNGSGWVTGRSRTGPDGSLLHAFIYRDGVMLDLNSLIDPIADAGWLLWSGQDITDDGRIVGWGILDGQHSAFVLTPIAAAPEPGSFALMLTVLGVLGLVTRRRKVVES